MRTDVVSRAANDLGGLRLSRPDLHERSLPGLAPRHRADLQNLTCVIGDPVESQDTSRAEQTPGRGENSLAPGPVFRSFATTMRSLEHGARRSDCLVRLQFRRRRPKRVPNVGTFMACEISQCRLRPLIRRSASLQPRSTPPGSCDAASSSASCRAPLRAELRNAAPGPHHLCLYHKAKRDNRCETLPRPCV
jgi:hypothetical protein